ncbi:MAG: PaaI family thioesterase [Solirubrobacteraceae bacterium]
MGEREQQVTDALKGSFPGDLGIEPLEIGERISGRMCIDARHLHPGGSVHGGAWVAFADTVAAWGTMQALGRTGGFTTVELKTNVFASARAGDELLAEARALHIGRRTQIWQVEIHLRERLAAHFVCTQLVL